MRTSRNNEQWQLKIQAARAVPIEKVIAGQGYTLTGKGNVLSTAEHDSIKIFLKSNSYYRYSTGKGGTAIDFLMNECGLDKGAAINYLATKGGYIETNNVKVMANKKEKAQILPVPFVLPPKAENNKRVYAYLSSRGLSGEIISDFIKKGLLYESADKHNCVFLGRDEKGKARAGYMRGTYTYDNKQYKGNIPGSEKQYGVFYEGASGTTDLYCFEAPIDMMSFLQLNRHSIQGAHMLALCGVDDTAMQNFLCTHPSIKRICFCLDADMKGREAANKLRDKYEELGYVVYAVTPPAKKDWNEYLQYHNPQMLGKNEGAACL